ncbi:MAG: hypothetical protein ACPGUE_08595 [Marinomonas sp.]
MGKLKSWLDTQSILPWVGFACTFGYFGLIIQIYGIRLYELQSMPLNEVGDFLAGAFGPIAFLWLIIGYLMQSNELKNQIQEFKKSIEISESQFEFNKRKEKRQNSERVYNALPNFIFEDLTRVDIIDEDPISFGESSEISFNIINTSSQISNVNLILKNSKEVLLGNINLHIFENGKTIKAKFSSDRIEEKNTLEIHYIDAIGNFRIDHYQINNKYTSKEDIEKYTVNFAEDLLCKSYVEIHVIPENRVEDLEYDN